VSKCQESVGIAVLELNRIVGPVFDRIDGG
jgi:hypothetical protein